MEEEDLADMKAMLAVARKRSLSFGICLGKKPETTVFLMDRKKPPEVVGRQAKKAGETAKIAIGTVDVTGKVISLTCHEDPPPGLARRMKLFLSGNNMTMKVRVLDADGGLLEDDGEEDEAEADGAADADDPAAQEWARQRAELEGLLGRALALNPANRTQLEAAWAMADEKAGAGDAATALVIAGRLRPALEKALASGASDTDAIPKNVAAFQKSRVLWARTREQMRAEMRKLEDAIIAICQNDPELEGFAGAARDLSDRLEVFDEKLETLLDRITNTAEGPDRDELKAEARRQIALYAQALKDPFFQRVDKGNGFTSVAVASTAAQSLNAIARTMA